MDPKKREIAFISAKYAYGASPHCSGVEHENNNSAGGRKNPARARRCLRRSRHAWHFLQWSLRDRWAVVAICRRSVAASAVRIALNPLGRQACGDLARALRRHAASHVAISGIFNRRSCCSDGDRDCRCCVSLAQLFLSRRRTQTESPIPPRYGFLLAEQKMEELLGGNRVGGRRLLCRGRAPHGEHGGIFRLSRFERRFARRDVRTSAGPPGTAYMCSLGRLRCCRID